EGNQVRSIDPRVIREHIIDPEYLTEVRKGMRQTVVSGTARLLQEVPVAVAAKTGTAQAGGTLTHAWFVAFAPYEKPEIAITVMVEHGGEGSAIAASITNEILKWYFSRHTDTGGNSIATSTSIDN
ncbi:MAG: penicillin-binding transpeptidase domain-containing protein, partial [Candidatus Sungbacteria bacterium]|nr:penicillin-binding transpeptidase domain-containing protein [Candidatus Sungbacteria bacterium]